MARFFYVFKLLCCFLLVLINFSSNSSKLLFAEEMVFASYNLGEEEWVDFTLNNMTEDEKIGQLMMVAAYSNKDSKHEKSIESLIKKYHLGGLIFFKGTPVKQVKLTNKFQKASKIPLMISIDGEWGLSMRLDSTVNYPHQLMLGAVQDNHLIYRMGMQIAEQCKRMGIHVNFAPVIDVNNNPYNPVINDRSFGEDKMNVSEKGMAYMRGMQRNGIMACGKHFPGHGDTGTDSHYDLPVLKHDLKRLEEVEFEPFKQLISAGLQSMMVAHMSIPALDDTKNKPSTLSKPIVTDLLKDKLGFEGLIFTDALNMKGVTKYYKSGEVEVKALQAGNDVLLFPADVKAGFNAIKKAIKNGELSEELIDERVAKILKYKYRLGLNKPFKPINTKFLYADLNKVKYELLNREIAESALTIAKNAKNILPLKNLERYKIATLNIGGSENNIFQRTVNFYAPADHFQIGKSPEEKDIKEVLTALSPYNLVIITLHDLSKWIRKNYGFTANSIDILNRIKAEKEVVLVVNGSPYALSKVPDFETLICTYEDNLLNQQLAAQLIFGGIPAKGKLPVTANKQYKFGDGFLTTESTRLKYTVPEEVGIDRFDLLKIDSLAEEAIKTKATPGCTVLMAKDGKVIHYKSYGHHTYSKKVKVHPSDLYDLASLTKVCATNLSLLKLHDEKVINIHKNLGKYYSRVDNTNKEKIKISDILIHEAGLVSWIPFYKNTLDEKGKVDENFSKSKKGDFNVEVANNFYMDKNYQQTMWDTILSSELLNKDKYKYSDVGYYMLKEMIEEQTEMPIEDYLSHTFYDPLGLSSMMYNPLSKFDKEWIVPTEKDTYWRNQLLHGHVHDMGAAMLGGVSGHAGLFSNANDIAVMFQMLLNGGNYGGNHFFDEEVVNSFTKKQKKTNRRGLGFDKPNFADLENSPCCQSAEVAMFGHTGFTGVCAWADPKYNTVYIFLSNRVHPKMNNPKLGRENYRPRIQQVLYDAMQNAGLNY